MLTRIQKQRVCAHTYRLHLRVYVTARRKRDGIILSYACTDRCAVVQSCHFPFKTCYNQARKGKVPVYGQGSIMDRGFSVLHNCWRYPFIQASCLWPVVSNICTNQSFEMTLCLWNLIRSILQDMTTIENFSKWYKRGIICIRKFDNHLLI